MMEEAMRENKSGNGNYAKLFVRLGAARFKMLPPVFVKNLNMGELLIHRHLGMNLVSHLARRLGEPVLAEYDALVRALENRSDLYEECQNLLVQIEAGNFIIYT